MIKITISVLLILLTGCKQLGHVEIPAESRNYLISGVQSLDYESTQDMIIDPICFLSLSIASEKYGFVYGKDYFIAASVDENVAIYQDLSVTHHRDGSNSHSTIQFSLNPDGVSSSNVNFDGKFSYDGWDQGVETEIKTNLLINIPFGKKGAEKIGDFEYSWEWKETRPPSRVQPIANSARSE